MREPTERYYYQDLFAFGDYEYMDDEYFDVIILKDFGSLKTGERYPYVVLDYHEGVLHAHTERWGRGPRNKHITVPFSLSCSELAKGMEY